MFKWIAACLNRVAACLCTVAACLCTVADVYVQLLQPRPQALWLLFLRKILLRV